MRPLTLMCGGVLAVCLAASAWAANEPPNDAPRAAAEAWLKLHDAGDHDACWNQSARYFKEHMTITKAEWREGTARYRLYQGKVVSRKVRSVELMDRLPLPDLPPGKHAIVMFDTVFERAGAMTETVTLMFEGGVWRVTATR